MSRNNRFLENIYLFRRKIKAIVYSVPFFLFRSFPVQKNKMIFWTLEGAGGYSCSPKYIAEEIIRRNRQGKTDYKLFWIVKDMSKEFPEEIIKVKDTWFNRAYHMTTARFWVGNTRTFWGTRKRKGTFYLQTWHGAVGLKAIGLARANKLSKIAYLVSKADSNLIDLLITGSDWCTRTFPEGIIYDGEIKQLGIPRYDVIVNTDIQTRNNLRLKCGIPDDAKIVIYAPTFRGGSQTTKRTINDQIVELNFEKIINAFEQRFGGDWYVLIRLHPQLAQIMKGMNVSRQNSKVIDVTQMPDMNEIIAATDAIITDYSSCLFDGYLNGQYGFIYADDIDDYVSDRGALNFQWDELPFPLATSENELLKNIAGFDEVKYRSKCKEFTEKCGVTETGDSSKKVVDYLLQLD